MIRIAVDAMGGDNAPRAVLEGCAEVLGESASLALLLLGPEEKLRGMAAEMGLDLSRIDFEDAPDVIGFDESPVSAIRKKKGSSIVKGFQAVAEGRAAGFVSAGSTGALLAGATFIVGRIAGIDRPALAPVLPTRKGTGALLIDSGANVDCQPQYLHQFALMGQAYMSRVMGVEQPVTALINNGTEAGKGNDLVKKSYAWIEQDPTIHFMGNIEARDALSGQAQVLVCDGFVGNIVLKSIEGTAAFIIDELRRVFYANALTKLAALAVKKGFKTFKNKLDYTEYGGAPLLGVKAPVVKAHGSSNGHALARAILQAGRMVDGGLVQAIEQGLKTREE